MLRHSAKVVVTIAAIVGVLGAGVAVAADPPTCPYGNTPQAAQTTTANRSGTQQRLRERDGTGPRHEQRSQQRGTQGKAGRHHGGTAPYRGSVNPSCPYRS